MYRDEKARALSVGYDARYAEFMAFSRGIDPNLASQTLRPFEGVPAIYEMLRCRYFFKTSRDNQILAYDAPAPPLEPAKLNSRTPLHQIFGRVIVFVIIYPSGADPLVGA